MKKISIRTRLIGLIIGALSISALSLCTTGYNENQDSIAYANSSHSQTIGHISVNVKYRGNADDFQSWNIDKALIKDINAYYVYTSSTPGKRIKFSRDDLLQRCIVKQEAVLPIFVTVQGSDKSFSVYELMPNTNTGQYDVRQVMDDQ